MPYPGFDRSKLHFRKLSERRNKVNFARDHVDPGQKPAFLSDAGKALIRNAAERIVLSRRKEKPVILAFGAHTIKNGLAPVLISLMENGWLTHLATNGAGIIHDWEFAYQGMTSEDVRENVRDGCFGIWEETGFYINLALCVGAYEGLGYGESIGKMIQREGLDIPEVEVLKYSAINNLETDTDVSASAADLLGVIRNFNLKPGFMRIPHRFKDYSVQAAAYRMGIPFTGHPMIGHDIIYTHPVNNGAAVGRTALNDFLTFTESVSRISEGVYISLGSAVMSPMIFEKALSMARNIKLAENSNIEDHYILVVDLSPSAWDWKNEGEPPANNAAYYLRHCKTFSRMGGEMDYLTADNRDFLLELNHILSNTSPFPPGKGDRGGEALHSQGPRG